jgi:hypothetical protein
MAEAAQAAKAQEQQAFLDAYNFLDNRWRLGKGYKEAPAAPPQAPPGEVPLAALRNVQPFGGLAQLGVAPPGRPRLDTTAAPLPGEPSWREEGLRWVAGELGGVELGVKEGGRAYTYRRVEGHPELSVMLRSRPDSWLWAARLCLLALAAAGWLLLRRGLKATTPTQK